MKRRCIVNCDLRLVFVVLPEIQTGSGLQRMGLCCEYLNEADGKGDKLKSPPETGRT